jgi:ADP-ribose pyrophosphatase YjhB (NUDIX family)
VSLPLPPRYCQACGGSLLPAAPHLDKQAPFYCSRCGQPVYQDPKVAVAVAVRREGGIVLLRRSQHDQAHGKWILPGGHVDRGEEITAAAAREVFEEIGLQVAITGLVGVYSYTNYPWLLVVYQGRDLGGNLRAGSEALEVAVFATDQLPWSELGYRSTTEALRDLLSLEN